jgi:hypothetical protein
MPTRRTIDSTPPPPPWELRIAWLALALILAAAAYDALRLHPGFAAYDEEGPLGLAQAWREGGALSWGFGKGSLHRALVALAMGAFGPGQLSPRLPALLAVALEGPLLFLWARPRLGARAALWSALALGVGTAALMRARMLVVPALLPALFLAHAVWLDRLRRPWQHACFGLSLALWLLDYDGWLLGVAVLLPLWLAPLRARRPRAFAAGAAAAALALAALLGPAVAAWWRTRSAVSWADGGPMAWVAQNTASLLGGGHRLAFSGVEGWPWPAPWTWPLTLLGLAPLARRWPASLWLALVGALPLALLHSGAEAHRMALLQVALALAAGVGAALLLARPGWRVLPFLLLAGGGVAELNAFLTRDPAAFQAAYGRSQDLMAAARWMQAQAPPQGWDLVDGLGPFDDATFRAYLDARGVRHHGGRPVALLHQDYLPAALGAGIKPVQGISSSAGHAVFLAFPDPAQAQRLRSIRAQLEPLTLAIRASAHPAELSALCAAWLRAPGHDDPWARTVAWEQWLHASLQSRLVDTGGVTALLGEPLVSGWAPDVLAQELQASQPGLAQRCRDKAVAVDPRRRDWSLDQRLARY